MNTCPASDCAAPVSSNGIACHAHFALVPRFIRDAWFRNRKAGGFTAEWLAEIAREAITEAQQPTQTGATL